jgi:diguanylate cyclase (GGDEF)-like protein
VVKSNHLNRFVAAVIALGAIACGGVLVFGVNGFSHFGEHEQELVLFALCALLGELVPLKVYTRGAEGETTTSTTFAVALLIAGGIEAALAGLLLANLVADLARRKPAHKIAFNLAQYAISVVAAGLVLVVLSDVPRAGEFHFAPGDLPAIMAAALVFFIVTTSLVAAVIAMVEGVGIWRYLVTDWFSQASTTGLMLGLSPIVVLAADYSLVLVTLLALPLFAIHRGGRAAIAKEHQAVHDALTGLPNRVLFRDRIDQAIHAARRTGAGCTVMLMDLNHFKEINDTLGHHQGDRLLQEVAVRLRATLRASDTVARLGGDEFGILLLGVADPVQAAIVAESLLERLREPFAVDATTLQVGGSIGVACHPAHGDDVETLIQRADIAMYAAKGASSGHAVFEPSQDHHSPRRLALAAELRGAIERSELVLAYQPKADLRTGRIVGVEALSRWEHPELGVLEPSEFVPIAEQTGLIISLTSAVLDVALERVAAWRALGYDISVAVNLSARSFLDAGLAIEIPAMLAERGVPPECLELEITESMLMHDPVRARATLERLAAIGVGVSVDDFGTGYSSLAHLKRLPVDTLKIDKSFVLDMGEDGAADAIVRSMIELAHNLGMRVVAEGVETSANWMRLAALGCDLAQGFHLARPLPASGVLALLEAESASELPLLAG